MTPENFDKAMLVHHPDYYCDIGAHVFPTRKFALVRERLLAEDPSLAIAEPEALPREVSEEIQGRRSETSCFGPPCCTTAVWPCGCSVLSLLLG